MCRCGSPPEGAFEIDRADLPLTIVPLRSRNDGAAPPTSAGLWESHRIRPLDSLRFRAPFRAIPVPGWA
jgi:hypothetical protein